MKKLAILMLLAACGEETIPEPPAPSARQQSIRGVKDYVASNLDELAGAAERLCAAAPEESWAEHPDAVMEMRRHWETARDAYERIEGAIAMLFPHLDVSTDERYDGFIAVRRDRDLFDGEGVTGMHAIERILWADAHPEVVLRFEQSLSGYRPAERPEDRDQAQTFRTGLCQRLLDDTEQMKSEFEPLALDPAAAYRGVIGSIEEQFEKVSLAGTGEDESRYADRTIADMRANLEGGVAIFETFEPWLQEHEDGPRAQAAVREGFAELQAEYARIEGEALPPVPAEWNPSDPSPEHLETPYGQLFALVNRHADPDQEGLLQAMLEGADVLDIAILPRQ
ncbi:MAG: imelysin family protein [Myxococcota bacterium]